MKGLKSFSPRETKLLYACIFLLAVVSVYGLGKEFLFKDWGKINENVVLTEKKIAKCLRILKQEEIIKKKHAQYVQGTIASNETEVAHMLRDVETIAKKNNVKTTTIKAKPIKEEAFYKEILVSVESEATMVELTKFIYALHQIKKNLRVKSIKIATSSKYAKSLTIDMVISRILVG